MINKLTDAIFEDDLALVNSILNAGVDINQLNRLGMTPLMVAVENENIILIELLLGWGADINKAGHEGFTALHHAVDISIDGTIQSCGKQGDEPLSIINYLIDNGADPNAKTTKGDTPLDIAISYKSKKVIDFLKNKIINLEFFKHEVACRKDSTKRLNKARGNLNLIWQKSDFNEKTYLNYADIKFDGSYQDIEAIDCLDYEGYLNNDLLMDASFILGQLLVNHAGMVWSFINKEWWLVAPENSISTIAISPSYWVNQSFYGNRGTEDLFEFTLFLLLKFILSQIDGEEKIKYILEKQHSVDRIKKYNIEMMYRVNYFMK